jgi:hypothetical protein
MDDIVDRLRSPEVLIVEAGLISRVAYQAADEIERLREDRKRLQEEVKHLQKMLAMVNLHKNAGYKVKTTGFDSALKGEE